VPVHVASAAEDHSVHFHQDHLADMGRVCCKEICELEDREASQGEIGKGYQVSRDRIIPISDSELRNLPLPTAEGIEIDAFLPPASIDPIRTGESCYMLSSLSRAARTGHFPVRCLNPAERGSAGFSGPRSADFSARCHCRPLPSWCRT